MTDPTPAATPLSQGDAGAQQVVRERGGCGEFLPNNRICILPSGHPQPHGEPAASDDLFTDDDVDAVLAIIDTDPIGPPTPGCDNCDLMQQECIRCEVRRALSAVAQSIAARARQRWFDLILRGEPEGPAAIHFCYLCDDIWESEPTCDHHEAIRKAIEFWTGRDHGPRARADAEEGK